MTTGLLTTLDLVKGQDAQGLIEETFQAFPEIFGMTRIAGQWVQVPRVGAAEGITGTSYPTLVTVEDPTVPFVDVNQGSDATKVRQEERVTSCFNMNPRWGVGLVAARRSPKSIEEIMANQALPHLRASWRTVAKCFYYGRNSVHGDTKAFPGLLEGYDTTNMEVDAGGTTDDVCSSAWLVAWGPESVKWVFGNGARFELSDIDLRNTTDSDSKQFSAYHQEMIALPGLQFLSKQHVCRIKKLTTDNDKGMTDALVASALSKFPVGVYPDVIFMSRRSLFQLQSSRTATNATGAPAPIPFESHNIPIAVTDSISNTEKLTL